MNKTLKILGMIAATLTAIIYFVLLTSFSFALSFTSVINKDNLKEFIKPLDVTLLPVGSVVSDQRENQFNDTETVGDFIEDTLVNSGFTALEAETILNSSELKTILNDYAYNIFEYSFYGKEVMPLLNSKDILTAITDSKVTLNKKKTNEIETLVTDLNNKASSELKIDKVDGEKVNYSEVMQYGLDIANSVWLKVGLGIAFVITFLLIALYTWSFYKPLIWLGVPSVVSGGLTAMSGSLRFITDKISISELGQYKDLFVKLLNPIFSKLLVTGLIILGLGILMVVCYSLIDRSKHKKEEPKLD